MARLANPLPSTELLARIFRYEEGLLYWTDSPEVPARVRGKPALNAKASNGYRFGRYAGQYLAQHRVIYKMVTGEEPAYIDHIDGDPANNHIANLRSVSHRANCLNRGRYSHNTSGITGVSWSKRDGKWMAFIHIDGTMKNLGLYGSKEAAVAARQVAESIQGYNVRESRPYV